MIAVTVAPGAAPAAPLAWDLVVWVVLGCLVASGFYSGAETGLMSTSRIRLQRILAGRPTARGVILQRLQKRLEEPILTCLIGTNLFNVLGSAVMTVALTARYGPRGELLALALMSLLIILFGEILPKILFREYPERLTLVAAPMLRASMVVLTPVLWLLLAYARLWSRLLPRDSQEAGGTLDRQTLSALLLAHAQPRGQDRQFRGSLRRFLALTKLDLRRLMRPITEVRTVPCSATVADCLQVARRSGFSRLPVVESENGDLTGWIQVRDLLFLSLEQREQPVSPTLVRTCLLVDEGMSSLELFEELHAQGQELAVVVDRQGRAQGLVTLEDLIEKVVGSIQDEFDQTWPGTDLEDAG